MVYAKVFTSGNSQAVRIPKKYNLTEDEMCIKRVGSVIMLFPKENPWTTFEQSLGEFTDDFMADGRNQPKIQVREGL